MSSETIFRVIPFSEALRERIKATRLTTGITNQLLIAKAVSDLPRIVAGLKALGFGEQVPTRPARLPFSDDSLADLRDASDAVGIPATRLLQLCLMTATEGTESPRKTRKPKAASNTRKSTKGNTKSKEDGSEAKARCQMMMLPLNEKSTTIFRKLTEGLDEIGDHRTIDNSDGVFMAVHVEVIGKPDFGSAPIRKEAKIVSIAHYYKQNGDMMKDPDMTFLATTSAVYPMSFEQSNPPAYQVAAEFRESKLYVADRLQKSITVFANEWLASIAEQQSL